MEARRRTWFDDRGLNDGRRSLPFYAGAMHYWRVPRARWPLCLRALHGAGFTIVETYVPWRVHQPEAGAPAKLDDLAAFLDAAKAEGLAVVLRPGPHVNAELTSFGIPDWVLGEPACQARTSRDTPAWLPVPPRAFPIPSYASTAFRAHVRRWYEAVAAVVAPYLGDPVVAIGVDNEAQMFFRAGAYDLDYHPDALAWWREFSGLDDPPRAWHAQGGDAKRCVEWVTFKDAYIARALGDFAHMLDEVGLGEVARFHNLPPGHHGLYDLRRIQRALGEPVGIDAYTPRHLFPELRRRAAACVANASPIPIAFEVGVGFFPWFPPLDTHDDPTRERDHLLTLLASGIRGFNIFMTIERDRYYGAAIDQHGKLASPWLPPLLATLAELDWPALRRATPIAVVDMRADTRFGLASAVLDPMTPVLADVINLGPAGAAELSLDKAAITARRWQTAVCRALELAQVPYAIIDETASEDELAKYRAVIAPTSDRIDRALWSRLRGLAEHKKSVVVIGPHLPTRDEFDQVLPEPLPRRMGRLKEASLDDLPGLAEDLAGLAGELPDTWQVERPDDVRTAVFADATGAARAIFLISDADTSTTAVLLADRALTDVLSKERFELRDGRVKVPMGRRAVRLLT